MLSLSHSSFPWLSLSILLFVSKTCLYFVQTIKNDDLEEIRELGSGTYGAVYHGKWKGSDVAIKRIKASCFAGRPSERERLVVSRSDEKFLSDFFN